MVAYLFQTCWYGLLKKEAFKLKPRIFSICNCEAAFSKGFLSYQTPHYTVLFPRFWSFESLIYKSPFEFFSWFESSPSSEFQIIESNFVCFVYHFTTSGRVISLELSKIVHPFCLLRSKEIKNHFKYIFRFLTHFFDVLLWW